MDSERELPTGPFCVTRPDPTQPMGQPNTWTTLQWTAAGVDAGTPGSTDAQPDGRTDGRSWIISVGRRGTDDTHRTNLYTARRGPDYHTLLLTGGRLGSRLVSALDSGAEGPGFKSQPRRCRVTVIGKLFTPIVPPFAKQRNW